MLMSTAGNPADVVLHSIFDTTFGVVGLYDVTLSDLTEERPAILPCVRLVLRAGEVAREDVVAIAVFLERNSEGMAELRPHPLTLRIEILEELPVVEVGTVNDLHDRVEVNRASLLRRGRLEAVKPECNHRFRHRRRAFDAFFRCL